MTANVEDYLKLIYQEGGKDKRVSNKIIADNLEIAPPSVTEMITKLHKQGYVHYTPYKGSLITEKGIQSCLPLVKGHRLWEVFLIEHLGYSWSEAHEDADLLEHNMSIRMIERLDKFLNYPKYCPHGCKIPREDDNLPTVELVPLSSLKLGDTGFIRRILEEKSLLDYVENIGLKIGHKFTIERIDAYEGPYQLLIDGTTIQLSYKATNSIFIESENREEQ